MTDTARIMAHMVACYPDRDVSIEAGTALIDGGASFLEIQFPFSDPTADGPRIQNACSRALAAGFTAKDGFGIARRFAAEGKAEVFIMTYGNVAYTQGIEIFVKRAKDAGVMGLIVPDLCPPEDEGLFEAGAKAGVHIVPVAAPGMADERIRILERLGPSFVYAALRKGVTGRETDPADALAFLNRLAPLKSRIFAGFGIKTREQVLALKGSVYAVVVGSLFVEIIDGCVKAGKGDVSIDLRKKIAYLCRGDE